MKNEKKNAIFHSNILKLTWEELGEEMQVKEIKKNTEHKNGHFEMKDSESPRIKKNKRLRKNA